MHRLPDRVEIAGESIEVKGFGWMDRQWMDETTEKGWQWFSVQLDDGTDIVCWNICDLDGAVESRDLNMMRAEGSICHTTHIELAATDWWISPVTEETYGTTWTLTEPKHDIDLEISARFPEQEIILLKEMPQYTWQIWEGGTTVSGHIDGSPVSGIGYAELVPRILLAG